MSNAFRPYSLDQPYLLPPSLREWLPEGHLALFVADVVASLDLSAITKTYHRKDKRGRAAYHPTMMVTLLMYAYVVGKTSSRKIELATYEDVPFRYLSGDSHPDHDSIAAFRKRHLESLAGLFVQVLTLAQEMGLVKLGHVALDGTKVLANASKHKAMSYGRMTETEARLKAEVEALLAQAESTDASEDAQFGAGNRGDTLPEELQRRESRLAKIAEAKAALEQAARDRAAAQAAEAEAKNAERARDPHVKGRDATVPDVESAKPDEKAQRNFTDPDSRIMLDGATKGFVQAYNAQIVVDDTSQIIVAADVTQQANDKEQLVSMLQQAIALVGVPATATADAGYFSEHAVQHPDVQKLSLFVATRRQKHSELKPQATDATVQAGDAVSDSITPMRAIDVMRAKLDTPDGRAAYAKRKGTVEPVFGQIKSEVGFRRFSFRGHAAVIAEWLFVCMAHNVRKLFRANRNARRAQLCIA